jgi:hypothetical protein
MINEHIHKDLASGRWFQLSLSEQLANIGSEYNRAISAKRRNNEERYRTACDRTLELCELTIDDPRWRNTPALKELCRLKEETARTLFEEQQPDPRLLSYFDGHAYAARLSK